MSKITVELPEELREFIETKVRSGDFANASEYIVALVSSARKTKSDLEAALIEGLQSGPADEWTSEEWADMRERITQRHSSG